MIASAENSSSASHQQSAANASTSDTPSNGTTPLPPDVAAARKARMNAELINGLKTSYAPGDTPYITGVGLYTHVEGSPGSSMDTGDDPEPRFLPIRVPEGRGNESSQPDELVAKLWKKLEAAIDIEDEMIASTQLGLKELRKRYGALPPPKNSQAPVQYVQLQHNEVQGDKAVQGGATTSVGNMGAPANPRSQSLAGMMASPAVGNENAGKGGTEAERARPPIVESTTDFYAPDPRRQGR